MTELINPPGLLYGKEKRINLYHVHNLYKSIAQKVSSDFTEKTGIDLSITSGMWGGSYLIARENGLARTNVVRLYSINSLPQIPELDKKENLDVLMEIFQKTTCDAFEPHQVVLKDPHWGETVPYTNRTKPNMTLQMWDSTGRAKFVRAFFVWNQSTWENSIIYDTVRNIKQIKEYLNVNYRPIPKATEDYKFVLQDVLIIYFALKPALTEDFVEHAQPVIDELFDKFLAGLHDPEMIWDQFMKVYKNMLVYGYEEAMEGPYQRDGLDIHYVEDWPVDKINWVPKELQEKLVPMIQDIFIKFKSNLEKQDA